MDIAWWHVALGVLVLLGGYGLLIIVLDIAEKRARTELNRTMQKIEEQKALVEAASDRDALEELVRNGADLNQQAGRGDTALHDAYFAGNTEAVTNLKAVGAPVDLPNSDGLLPHEMAAVAHSRALIEEGVALITNDGWIRDAQDGRRIWSALRTVSKRHYYVALDRALPFTNDGLDRKYAIVAIKVGQPGTEVLLCRLLKLRGPGTADIVTDFLNSGNGTLRTEAERWALANEYKIVHHTRGGSVTWGSS